MKTCHLLYFVLYLALSSATLQASADDPGEPAWLPPLAEGSAPACPGHPGVRNYRSEIAQSHGLTAEISGASLRSGSACTQEAHLLLSRSNRETRVPLKNPAGHTFSIIDFSPDNSRLLISIETNDFVADDTPGSQLLGLIHIADGKLTTWSVWKVMGWKNCDATVELQGFLPDGNPIIRARPSTWNGHPNPNCVLKPELYAFNSSTALTEKLDDTTKLLRYGQEIHTATQSCKLDPDLVAECFTVHGRLDFYNGGPSTRIWVVGTHHMLGVDNEIVPENVEDKLDWDTDVFGDFLVCPFAREQTGHMQSVCVESADHLRAVPRK